MSVQFVLSAAVPLFITLGILCVAYAGVLIFGYLYESRSQNEVHITGPDGQKFWIALTPRPAKHQSDQAPGQTMEDARDRVRKILAL